MDVFKIVGFAIIAAVLSVVLRQYKSEYSMFISLVCTIFLVIFAIGIFSRVYNAVDTLAQAGEVNTGYLAILFKVIGIAYLVQFASDICRDSGENAIASKVEVAGRAIILLLSLPLYLAVFELLSNILSQL